MWRSPGGAQLDFVRTALDAAQPMPVVVTYCSDDWRKLTFDIPEDGQKVAEQVVERGGEPRFFDVQYPIPARLVGNKSKVMVRFQATKGNVIAAVFWRAHDSLAGASSTIV